jgi:hypothetical protein
MRRVPKQNAKSNGPDMSASVKNLSSHFLNKRTDKVFCLIFSKSIPKSFVFDQIKYLPKEEVHCYHHIMLYFMVTILNNYLPIN